MQQFFDFVQKACLPGVWSKGVSLARTDSVIEDSVSEEEIVFRVQVPSHPVSRKVTLWPQDEDWFCDCEDRNDVCPHVAAAIIYLKSGKKKSVESTAPQEKPKPQISYKFTRNNGLLHFDRWIRNGQGQEERLADSLVSWMGGIQSGRIQAIPIAATKEDYSVDYALNAKRRGELDRITLHSLLKALSQCSNIYLDEKPITVSPKSYKISGQLIEEGSGFRLSQKEESTISEVFKNGAVLCGTVLSAFEVPVLTEEEREILSGKGKFFSSAEVKGLVTQILPSLNKKIQLEVLTENLPKVKEVAPKVVLQMEKIGDNETLTVIPTLVYEEAAHRNEILISDPTAEKMLARKLQNELQLALGQRVKFEGTAAVEFCMRLKNWECSGEGKKQFTLKSTLIPKVHAEQQGFGITFTSNDEKGEAFQADPEKVFRAWRENAQYVPLLGGGWAPLPQDWLNRYGERIEALAAAKQAHQRLPSYLLPQVVEICEELHQPYPDTLKNLQNLLNHVDLIQNIQLPSDLKANLRHYQEKGVSWLCFLREAGMGAMLADDMGLGKTLQALCAVRGRTLIVAPTSVLHSWKDQVQQFRPSLKVSVYYGNQRKLDQNSDIILTTYGLLRLDREAFMDVVWDTVILDEAQVIKNPESQIARAAHQLQAEFRIALSGTPIENRLDDLWSQFQFLNPGLLGSREAFQDSFSQPISRGDQNAAQRLRNRIKPFILRRLKKEVAPELPPRTETVLTCELSSEERDVYDSVLASTRTEVLEKLDAGGSVFAALELLLRLRQACCHTSLVPGQKSDRSSKIELLVQTLENSIALGHQSLVFSQWTGYLDLIEEQFKKSGIRYNRLDGSTRNRDEVVSEFQSTPEISVMLISLKAGGVGLTLTAADHIYLMDPWWNPAVEDQAADRAHRIGQVNPVLIHRLVAQDTIEERILGLQKSKQEMAAAVLQDGSAAVSLTREDLKELLLN